MVTRGRMSACVRAALSVTNTANSSVSLVSKFRFFIQFAKGTRIQSSGIWRFRRPFCLE